MSTKKLKQIPLSVIQTAIEGDGQALAIVINHYNDYICCLSIKKLKDEIGNEYLCVDEDVRLRLETKLISSIVCNFKLLPS